MIQRGARTAAASRGAVAAATGVAGGLVIKPLPGLHIRVEADWFSGSEGGDKADFLDDRAQIEWYDLTYAGPYAGLGVKF